MTALREAEHARMARLAHLLRQVANELDAISARVGETTKADARRALGGEEA